MPDLSDFEISLTDIRLAAERIEGLAFRTRLRKAQDLGERLGADVWLKLENMQDTGAFKVRGAANKLLSMSEEDKARGVITVSSGNHGRALAYVARTLGVRAVVCLAEIAPPYKVEGIRSLGAEVVIGGVDQDAADANAQRLAQEQGLTFVSPFDDAEVIAGQGTTALEMLQTIPDLDTLIIPLSGGGLMSGMAIAAKSINPNIQIIGVSTREGAAILESIKAGKIVTVGEPVSLADALPGPIPLDNKYTFKICAALVDRIVQVDEDHIGGAMAYLYRSERLILEGAGAACVGAALVEDLKLKDQRVGIVCSGANISLERFHKIVNAYDSIFSRSTL